MELKNLSFVGKGNMVDQQTGEKEDIEIISEIDLCQLVLTPEQEVTEDGLVQEFVKDKNDYLQELVDTIDLFTEEWLKENEETNDVVSPISVTA